MTTVTSDVRATGGALRGARVLIPRGGTWGERVAAEVARRGGEGVIAPLIASAAPRDEAARDACFAALAAGTYAWLFVTSAASVEQLVAHGVRVPESTRIAVVGPATGRAVTSAGWTVGFQPDGESSAVTLAAQWCASHDAQAEGRVLILRSDLAGAHLSDELQAHGFTVDIGIAYRTVGIDLDPAVVRDLREGAIDIVLLTSLSVARELRRQIGPLPDRVRVASIGPGTTRDAEHIGFTVAHTATTQSVDELLAELDAACPSDASPLRDDPRDRRDAHTSHDQETRA